MDKIVLFYSFLNYLYLNDLQSSSLSSLDGLDITINFLQT